MKYSLSNMVHDALSKGSRAPSGVSRLPGIDAHFSNAHEPTLGVFNYHVKTWEKQLLGGCWFVTRYILKGRRHSGSFVNLNSEEGKLTFKIDLKNPRC